MQEHLMNILLIGFMGTGKSTIGRILAQKLGWQYIDIDARIEAEQGKSISRIFQMEGEASFRRLEAEKALELASFDHQVISTGGGFVLNPQNLKVFKPDGLIIALAASPAVIYQRVKNEKHRPLLEVADPLARIGELLAERLPYYRNADLQIDTAAKNPAQIVAEIMEELMRRGFIHGRSQTEFS